MYVTMDVTFFETKSFFHKVHLQGERSCEDLDPMSFLAMLESEELGNGSSCGDSLGSSCEDLGISGGENMIQVSQDPRSTLETSRSPLENIEQPQPQPSLEINIFDAESEGHAINM